MIIETKYQLGDNVYICSNDKIIKGYIRRVHVDKEYNNDIYDERYTVSDKNGTPYNVDVSRVFYNIDDLVKSFNL